MRAGRDAAFGELYGVPVYANHAMGQNGDVVFQGGTHDLTMRLPYIDFERVARPKVDDISVTR